MRILALDIGEKRIGLAISDSSTRVASPLCILDNVDVINNSRKFQNIVEEWQVDSFLIGLPLSLTGDSGKQAEFIKNVAKKIKMHYPNINLELYDERFSSKEAKKVLQSQDYSEKDMRLKLDSIAASIFLQSYLDSKNLA